MIRLVALGKSNKEIANLLLITERTVEFHVGNLLLKLEVSGRVQAALWAKDHGLCE